MNWQEGEIKSAVALHCNGRTVLDIGGYDGRQARAGLDAGAISAACVDDRSWQTYDKWKQPIEYAGVNYIDGDIFDYDEPADVVVAQNVIYHFRNPWALLEKVRRLTRYRLVLESSVVKSDPEKRPVWVCYRPYEGHPVSWTVAWRPTKEGLVALLEATGFADINIRGEDAGAIVIDSGIGPEPKGFGERR